MPVRPRNELTARVTSVDTRIAIITPVIAGITSTQGVRLNVLFNPAMILPVLSPPTWVSVRKPADANTSSESSMAGPEVSII